ncbi:hypothetical protein ACLBYD_29030 [Rhodococcus sp. C26F]
MTLAEIRKGLIAVLGAIVAVVPQVLASLAGVIPTELASWLTITASIATAVLVYLVPNEKREMLQTVQTTVTAPEPAIEQIKERLLRESKAALERASREFRPATSVRIVPGGAGGGGGATSFGIPVPTPDPEPPTDPFVVNPAKG